jgi:predicted ATP-dependent serine protease
MQNLYMFMCDTCGYYKARSGMCPNCQTPLTMYSKESQREYQVDMEEPMRSMHDLKWYL